MPIYEITVIAQVNNTIRIKADNEEVAVDRALDYYPIDGYVKCNQYSVEDIEDIIEIDSRERLVAQSCQSGRRGSKARCPDCSRDRRGNASRRHRNGARGFQKPVGRRYR